MHSSQSRHFAAALRDYREKELVLACLFGEKTFGKGTVQATYRIDGGAAFKLSIATYKPPYGEGYDGIGITPDRIVPLPEEYRGLSTELVPRESDTQLRAALDWLATVIQ